MKIKDIGGEFAMIKRIAPKQYGKSVVKGVGDDAAVLKLDGKLYLFCSDALVEGNHFILDYFTPEQVGMKAIEVNVSDVGAMGGIPKYCVVSLVLPANANVEFVDGLYKGIRKAAKKYGIDVVGGDTTHGKEVVIDVAMIGTVKKEDLCLRSSAKPGDFILISGDVGGSTAGLKVYEKKIKGHLYPKKKQVEPKAKFEKVKPFLKSIHAMIDVSDGVASDIQRICEESGTGATIFADNIPIKDEVRKAAKACCDDPLDYALYGGEDFELVFTVSEKDLGKVKGYLIGEITKKKGVYLYSQGKEKKVNHGYDHFLRNL